MSLGTVIDVSATGEDMYFFSSEGESFYLVVGEDKCFFFNPKVNHLLLNKSLHLLRLPPVDPCYIINGVFALGKKEEEQIATTRLLVYHIQRGLTIGSKKRKEEINGDSV